MNRAFFTTANNRCSIRADVHHLGNRTATPILGHVFKQLANLEEKHNEYGLGKHRRTIGNKADNKRTNGGDTHQKVFAKNLSFSDALKRFKHHVIAGNQIRRQID